MAGEYNSWRATCAALGIGANRRGLLFKLAANASARYRRFDARMRGTGKWRHIDHPQPELKRMQRRIYDHVLRPNGLPGGMFGALPGTSVRDHAALHIGQPIVVCLDLKDCFPTTTNRQVFRVFRDIGCGTDVASLLTKLTTLDGHLPQGAPSSPMLSQLALVPMFRELQTLCNDHGMCLSLYVDDLAFSGDGADRLVDDAVAVIQRHGRRLRTRKTRVMSRGTARTITSLSVHDVLGVPRHYRDECRRQLLDAKARGGISEAELARLLGKVNFVRWINAAQARHLDKLLESLPPAVGPGGRELRAAETADCPSPARCRARVGETRAGERHAVTETTRT